jgi:hypothetical protein
MSKEIIGVIGESKDGKIYCKDCKFFKHIDCPCGYYIIHIDENEITGLKTEHKIPQSFHYWDKNKNNDCKYFEPVKGLDKLERASWFQRLFGWLFDNN